MKQTNPINISVINKTPYAFSVSTSYRTVGEELETIVLTLESLGADRELPASRLFKGVKRKGKKR